MLSRKDVQSTMILVAIALVSARVEARTPKLNIRTRPGIPMEEQRKEQMERLAWQYDLKKVTVTRDMMERHHGDNRSLFDDLQRAFPNMSIQIPAGDGELRSSYLHIAVCMLEWPAMEDLVGTARARKAIEMERTRSL